MLSSSRILHHPSDDRASKRVKIDVDETGKDDDGDDDFLADLVVENVHGEEIGQHQQNVEEESVRNTHEDEEIRRLETAVFGHGKSAVVNLSDIHVSNQFLRLLHAGLVLIYCVSFMISNLNSHTNQQK